MVNDVFELIDLKSGNVASDYDRRDEALAALRAAADEHGWPAIANFSLMHIRGEDQTLIAKQAMLVQLVQQFKRSNSPATVSRQPGQLQGQSGHLSGQGYSFAVRHNKVRSGRSRRRRGRVAVQPTPNVEDQKVSVEQ